MTTDFNRRKFLGYGIFGAVAVAGNLTFPQAKGATAPKVIRIGYQKNGVLVIARRQAALEKLFGAQGIAVNWVEFFSGPPMMEAMNAGSIDFGAVGDSPPIFAQAAGANIVYAAGQPITNGQGILVPQNSPIRTLADLRGKRVGFTKGSSANNFTIAALESAGLAFADITPVYLNPPDAGPAFANGGIDAWAIWDPYFAIGESRQNARILVNAKDIVKTNSFYIANGDFARRHPGELRGIVSVLADVARWAEDHRDEVAKALSEVTNIPLDIQTIAANRSAFAIGPITDEIIETQQGVADRYFRLGLIPNAIVIRDAVWKAPQS